MPSGLFSTEKYHLSSLQLLPSNCRAARCSSFILSLSSFFVSILAISSAVSTAVGVGAASRAGDDLPERATTQHLVNLQHAKVHTWYLEKMSTEWT